ncbi:MAG TPA: hypothetical protein ENN80_00195 [Candidatus Hydrogenedentes bacterium]|nr:hypothetical protein [Candidatus Hydrogenedentota bacterium]
MNATERVRKAPGVEAAGWPDRARRGRSLRVLSAILNTTNAGCSARSPLNLHHGGARVSENRIAA